MNDVLRKQGKAAYLKELSLIFEKVRDANRCDIPSLAQSMLKLINSLLRVPKLPNIALDVLKSSKLCLDVHFKEKKSKTRKEHEIQITHQDGEIHIISQDLRHIIKSMLPLAYFCDMPVKLKKLFIRLEEVCTHQVLCNKTVDRDSKKICDAKIQERKVDYTELEKEVNDMFLLSIEHVDSVSKGISAFFLQAAYILEAKR